MPARGKIRGLPADVQRELEARLISQGFAGYRELADWLAGQGYEISHAAVHRHGQALERRIAQIDASTRAATALMETNPDAEGNLAAATLKAAQSCLFDLLMAAEDGAVDPDVLAKTVRAAADAARANVTIQRERERVLAEVKRRAEESAEALERDHGAALPPDVLRRIRRDIYGIHDAV